MRRRNVIGAMCGVALALPRRAAAQQPGKVWRIGHVLPTTPEWGEGGRQALEQRLADLAIAARLPSCDPFRRMVIAGGLVSLDADRLALTRPAAAQIDKIIKGTSPADIPVEQPTRFELYINLKTARLLNLTIPPTLLALADEVIE